jgi:opacity protein-like surface antigen
MMRAALAVALLAATSSAASAGVYVGVGIGTNASTESTDRLVEDGRSARLLVGYRFNPMQFGGAISIEGSFDRYGLGLLDRTSIVGIDANQLSLAAKLNIPLADHFEAFGRLGVQHTSATADVSPIYDTSGNGFLVGAGMEYRFNPGVGSGASLTVDYQINKVTLSGERFAGASAFGVIERQWTLGVALAF